MRCYKLANGGNTKSPVVAAILSFFIPGLGQVYNGGGYLKGLMYLIGTIIAYMLLIVPGIIVYIYNIYNAYAVAKKVNAGVVPFKQVGVGSLLVFVVLGFVIIFVGVVAFTFVLTAIIGLTAFIFSG